MEISISEWLNLLARWFHVIAGIMWIGQTYLFNWMERHLPDEIDAHAKPNVAGQLWMVHGGGFYYVEKQKVPELMPRALHWFKWESAWTWISGMLLLTIVYYMGGALVEPDGPVSETHAIAIGAGTLVLGWALYSTLWRSPLGKNEPAGASVSFILILIIAYGLSRVLSARAVYIHIGSLFGTIMAANVWMKIMPAQRNMVEALKAGRKPDMTLAARAKQCSKHNTFMSVPLIFTMISSHFPTASYGSPYSVAILGALILAGWLAAKIIREH